MAYSYKKKPIRSFRDLDVYARTLQYALQLEKLLKKVPSFPNRNHASSSALSIPLAIARAHSLHFSDNTSAHNLLEEAMAHCNTVIVYIEDFRGMYEKKISFEETEELIKNYLAIRTKIFRLQKAWSNSKKPSHSS